jgi:hypothetical protein
MKTKPTNEINREGREGHEEKNQTAGRASRE